MTALRTALSAVCAVALLLGLGPAATAADEPTVGAGGLVSLAPARLLDTRTTGAVPANGTLALQVTGRGGVPATDVAAVVLNVTAVNPTAAGYLTAYPDGSTRPTASNLNYLVGQTTPNTVVVKVGTGGRVALFNGSPAPVQLVADIAGYVVAGAATAPGTLTPVDPARLLDTRTGTGTDGTTSAVPAGGTLSLQVSGQGGVPASGVAAVVLNVTAVTPAAPGYLTAYPDGTARPTASNLNYLPGQTTPNTVVVKLGAGGKVALYNGSSGTAHLVADVAGYVRSGTVTAAGGLTSVDPARLLDTRVTGAVPAGGTLALQVLGQGGVPASGVTAVVLNVTAVDPAAPGYLTAYPDGATRPTASNLNYLPGRTTPNTVVVKVGSNGKVALYNGSGSAVHLVADVAAHVLPGRGANSYVPEQVSSVQRITDVACASATSCVATTVVPAADWAAPRVAHVVETDDTAVRVTRLTLPGDSVAGTSTSDVTACSTATCLVAGTYATAAGQAAYVSTRSGSTWTPRTLTVPAGGTAPVVTAADCAGTTCVLLGTYTDPALGRRPFANHVTGGTWSTASITVAGAGSLAELDDLDCAAAGSCTAVGRLVTSGGEPQLLTARLQGGSWTTTATSFSVPAGGVVHAAVGCPSATVCTVGVTAGRADGTGATTTSLGTSTDGAAWSLAPAGIPAGSESFVSEIDCAAGVCVAVGTTFDGVGTTTPLVRRFASGTWGADGGPTGTGSVLTDVSCADATTCVATGYDDTRAILATRSPSGWTTVDITPAWASEAPIPQALVCSAPGRCTVVGDTVTTGFVVR